MEHTLLIYESPGSSSGQNGISIFFFLHSEQKTALIQQWESLSEPLSFVPCMYLFLYLFILCNFTTNLLLLILIFLQARIPSYWPACSFSRGSSKYIIFFKPFKFIFHQAEGLTTHPEAIPAKGWKNEGQIYESLVNFLLPLHLLHLILLPFHLQVKNRLRQINLNTRVAQTVVRGNRYLHFYSYLSLLCIRALSYYSCFFFFYIPFSTDSELSLLLPWQARMKKPSSRFSKTQFCALRSSGSGMFFFFI